MNCAICLKAAEADAAFCGHCGQRLIAAPEPLSQRHNVSRHLQASRIQQNITLEREAIQMPLRHTKPELAAPANPIHSKQITADLPRLSPVWQEPSPSGLQPGFIEPITSAPRGPQNSFARSILILVTLTLLVSSIAVGAYALAKTSSIGGFRVTRSFTTQTQGQATFSDGGNTQGITNSITLTLKQLAAPEKGTLYQAWLIDDQEEHITSLGPLTAQGTSYTLKRTISQQNLLSLGNRIQVTQERGQVSVPTGKTIFKADFPPMALIHLRHLLVRLDETPGQVGLLVGLREQARQLNEQATLLSNNAENTHAIRCIAQNIVNIVEGKQGARYAKLAPTCKDAHITSMGDGFGLLGNGAYIDHSLMHVSLAATQSDSSSTIKQHAGQVRAVLENIRAQANQLDQIANNLLQSPQDGANQEQSIALCKQIFEGKDANHDDHIDAIHGEGGALTAYTYGQLMAQLNA